MTLKPYEWPSPVVIGKTIPWKKDITGGWGAGRIREYLTTLYIRFASSSPIQTVILQCFP